MRMLMFGLLVSVFLLVGVGCGANQPKVVELVHLGYGVYRFNANDELWIRSLVKFVGDHPELRITAIYSAIESSYGWTKSVLVVTEGEIPSRGETELERSGFVEPIHLGYGVYRFNAYDELWIRSLVKFVGDHPELRITAIYSAIESSYGWTKSVLVVTERR